MYFRRIIYRLITLDAREMRLRRYKIYRATAEMFLSRSARRKSDSKQRDMRHKTLRPQMYVKKKMYTHKRFALTFATLVRPSNSKKPLPPTSRAQSPVDKTDSRSVAVRTNGTPPRNRRLRAYTADPSRPKRRSTAESRKHSSQV